MNGESKTVAFHTLGCKLNFAETSTISRQFENQGYVKKEFSEKADLYVINTCSVTENADKEFRKIVNRAKRASPDAQVAVVGCYAQLKPELIASASNVDIVLGMKDKFKILDHLKFHSSADESVIIHDSDLEKLHSCVPSYSLGDRTRSFLKIQDGCDYPCTYCTIPLARGSSRSIAPEVLIQQAQEISAAGVKEIVLTGVNVGDYKRPEDIDLLYLLERFDQIESLERVRISSIEPNLLTDEIIDFVAESRTILPHFHIPLQSGSDTILRSMKRRYDRAHFQNRVARVRDRIPHAGIGIDVIVGFPGETEREFQNTLDFLGATEFSYLHVFTYSERPDTEAIELPGRVDAAIRKLRNKELTELSKEKNMVFALSQMNQTRKVLFETCQDGLLSGMTDNYLKIFVRSAREDLVNKIAAVEITAIQDHKVYGRLD